MPELSRRELIPILLAGSAVLKLPAAVPGAPLFFTPSEFALLDCVTELIIPTDDHSPGAHEAGVAIYIDRMAAEAILPEDKQSWRKGLASLQAMSSGPFQSAPKTNQVAMLTKLSEQNNKFFKQLKETTAFAYYTTSIGIHKEMEYKGNVLLNQFVGYNADDTDPLVS